MAQRIHLQISIANNTIRVFQTAIPETDVGTFGTQLRKVGGEATRDILFQHCRNSFNTIKSVDVIETHASDAPPLLFFTKQQTSNRPRRTALQRAGLSATSRPLSRC